MTPTATDRLPDGDLRSDHELLCGAVRAGGAVAARYFGGPLEVREKRPGDPVSEADLAVDRAMRDIVTAARPDYAWLTEEAPPPADRHTAPRVWVVDPIDGTKVFIEGVPDFVVSLALVEAGRPVAGAIFNPIKDEFVDAWRGGGTRLNGDTVTMSRRATLPGAVLGSSHNELRRNLWKHLFPECTIEPVDAIAYKLALLAAGRFDAVISRRGKSDWDIAAGDILIHEAGGVMTGLDGRALLYNGDELRHPGLIGAGTALLPAIRDRLQTD